MPAVLLYLVCALVAILLVSRYLSRMTVAAAIVLILLPLCFTGRALLTGRVYAPLDLAYESAPLQDYAADYGITRTHHGWLSDLSMQMIPWRHAVRGAIASGEWPLWNRFMLCGSILAGNMQSAPYDPLQLVSLLLPEEQALTFGPAMTFFLAGLFTFLFLRLLACREPASLIGSAAYMFNGLLAFFVGWPLGRAWALLPLVLIGVRLLVRESSVRGAVALTAGFVLVIFAGHPETVLHVVTIGAIYGIYEVIVGWTGLRTALRPIGLAVVCGVLALLLTAVSLLPFAAVAGETYEHLIRSTIFAPGELPVEPGAVMRRAMASLYAFVGGQPQRNVHVVGGFDPTTIRVGSIALSLAICGLFFSRRRERWLFVGIAIAGVWIGLNAWPFAHLLHRVPLFDIALNERLAFAAAFAIAVLAAFAVDAWPRDLKKGLAFAAVVAVVALLLAWGVISIRAEQRAAGISREFLIEMTLAALAPLAVLVLLLALRVRPQIALPLVLALLLGQRIVEDGAIYPAHHASAFYPQVPVLQHMQNDSSGPFRVIGLGGALMPDAAALYDLEDARGYEAMTFLRLYESYRFWSEHQGWYNRIDDKSRPFLSALNVKYAIGSIEEQPDEQWKLVMEDRQTRLFENSRVLPRAFVPSRVLYARDPDAILQGMLSISDFGEAAVITAPEEENHDSPNGPGWLITRRSGSLRYDIEAKMDGAGWIVLSETAWPGWRAWVNGKPVRTRFANHAFLGVFVPQGEHTVRLVYRPTSFVIGRWMSGLTLLAIGIFFLLRRYRFKKPGAVGV